MNKPLRRVISATLALSLSVTLAVNAYAEEIAKVHKQAAVSAEVEAVKEKSEKAKKPEKIKITKDNLPEVLDFERVKGQGFVSRLKSEEQDMCEIVLENEDGTRGLYVFDSPVKFKNEKGETVDKSNKVKPHTKNGAPCFKSESNDIEVHLPATIQGGVSLKDEEVNVSMKPIPSVMSKRALSVGKQKDENSVVYEDVFDNFTDIVYTFTYDGVKEDIVLEKYNGKNTFDFEVITGGLSLEEEKGALLLKDENGEVKATMGEIVIFSADNKNNIFGEYKITEKQKNNSYIITVCVDVAYLTSPDTKYPVTIDPPINSVKDNCGIEDMQVFKGTDGTGKTETSAGRSGVSRVGWTDWGACRTLMRFANLDLSNKIKDPKQINTAYIELRDLMCQGDATSIMCSEFTGESWEESDVRTWNNLSAGSYDASSLPVNVSYSIGYNNTSKHWYRWDIKAIAKKWVGNKNYQNKGVVFRLSNSTYENNSKYAYYMKTFSSMQGSEIYKPYFYIEYNYYVPVTNVRFSISSLTLEEKETYTFHPIITPNTATNQQFTWTSSNTAVATVSSSGKVTAKEAGTTTIKARSKANSSAEATCKVTVKLADGDNDEIPDIYDEEPDSIAILTIFSAPPGNGTSCEVTKAGIDPGHSFLTLKNITNDNLDFRCITIPSGEELSIGSWEYELHNGIQYNYDSILNNRSSNEFKGRVSLSIPVSIDQYELIEKYTAEHDTWSHLTNCSSFACGLWNEVVPEEYTLYAGTPNLPNSLASSIKTYKDKKLYNYYSIYNYEREIAFSKEFNQKVKGYINEFGEFVVASY